MAAANPRMCLPHFTESIGHIPGLRCRCLQCWFHPRKNRNKAAWQHQLAPQLGGVLGMRAAGASRLASMHPAAIAEIGSPPIGLGRRICSCGAKRQTVICQAYS
jgi:hypothetical protein